MAQYNQYPKIKRLKMLILDVDGVLTKGGISYITGENTSREFDVKDGLGLVILKSYGFRLAIITGKKNEMATRRAEIIGIDDVFQGFPHKLAAYEELKRKYDLKDEECAFIGDDLIDLAVIKQCGFGVAVADAHPAVKLHADYVTMRPGGRNAVREITDLILSFKIGDFSTEIPIPEQLTAKWETKNLA